MFEVEAIGAGFEMGTFENVESLEVVEAPIALKEKVRATGC